MATVAAALALAACSRRTHVASSGARGALPSAVPTSLPPTPGPITIGDWGTFKAVPHLLSAFEEAHPGIRIIDVPPSEKPPTGIPCIIEGSLLGQLSGVPLDAAVRAINFQTDVLLPAALAPCYVGGQLLGLPLTQVPTAIRWRKDVFAAAGLAPPSSNWTLDEFEGVCTEIQAFITTGKFPGVSAVLLVPSRFATPANWFSFVTGFGGTVAANGEFAFDSRALEGLSAYLDLLRRFTPVGILAPGGKPTNYRGSSLDIPDPKHFALALDLWIAPPQRPTHPLSPAFIFYDDNWSYARLPHFPQRSVITTTVLPSNVVPVPGEVLAPADVEAAATALVWRYTSQAQTLLNAYGYVPVLSASAAQRAFWSQYTPFDREVGDWKNFVPWSEGWPGIPPNSYMNTALSAAAKNPAQLATAVETAVKRMNVWLSTRA